MISSLSPKKQQLINSVKFYPKLFVEYNIFATHLIIMILKNNYIGLTLFLCLIAFTANAQQGKVKVTQDSDIDKLLEYKKDIKTSKVYKIQVYQSVDPDMAEREKENFLNLYEEWPAEIIWNTPNYKVWVGNFATRLEADRAWAKIKKNYMNAIIFQPKLDND